TSPPHSSTASRTTPPATSAAERSARVLDHVVALFSGHAPIVVKETPAVTQHFASISIEQVKDVVVPILLQHGAMRAGLFGSLVHGKLGPRSDIDILVELPRNLSLLDVIGIQQEL